MIARRSLPDGRAKLERAGGQFRSVDGMMHVSVNYQDERLEFEVPEERVVASWSGPAGLDVPQELAAIRDAWNSPGNSRRSAR